MTTTVTELKGLGNPGRLRRFLETPQDLLGLATFRALFGAILFYSTVRFVASGWVDELLLAPKFHFTYPGFSWIQPWPRFWMFAHFGLMAVTAVGIALGFATRICAAVFFLAFTYVELIDKTTYLNHYYFVSLMTCLLVVFPCDGALSYGSRRRIRTTTRLTYLVFRFQVAVVYLFAGLAKLNADWLFRAEPLRGWLGARVDIAPILGEPATAYAFSWAGALFDLTIVFLLLVRRTRAFAYVGVVIFHLITASLFPIGVFPWVMMAAATLLFDPSWPRRWLARFGVPQVTVQPQISHLPTSRPLSAGIFIFTTLFCTLQLVLPLRHLGQRGAVNWDEQGFRFAWRVMLIEKAGMVEYQVVTSDGRKFREFPRKELTALQYRMMATQPDMIVDYARHLAERYEAAGHGRVAVFATSFAALNRRTSQPLMNSRVDLAAPGPLPQNWIVPLKSE